MPIEHPVIVVGVPVFNEARYLRDTLNSLQSQTWKDFAVLIADNASSDGSDRIASEMCEKDPRFHLHRHPSNVGSLANFQYLRDATRSPLFMWLGAHDLLHPDFLSETIAVHHRNPAISLAYSLMRIINTSGATECLLENRRAARMPFAPMPRYLHAYRHVHGYEINHLLRRSAFDDFEFRDSISWDLIFLAHLAFHGPFKCIPTHLYSVRNVHPRLHESEQETMERLTGEKGRTGDTGKTITHVTDDFTRLARGRIGWKIFRSLLRSVVIHRTRPGGLGLVSTLLRLTAPARTLFSQSFRPPAYSPPGSDDPGSARRPAGRQQ